jgi:Domain of unknown function (DUF4157)
MAERTPARAGSEAIMAALQQTAGNGAVAVGVQRMPRPGAGRCACGGQAGPDGECAACRARRLAGLSVQRAPLPGAPAVSAAAPPGWLAEDGTENLAPGQMQKSDWLAQLRVAICARAEQELASTRQTTDGCPVLGFWIGYFSGRAASEVSAAAVRYAPEIGGISSAADAIAPIVERVGAAVAVWVKTGQVTGIPEGAAADLGAVASGAMGGGGVQRKGRNGAGAPASSGSEAGGGVGAILGRLGAGRPLDAGVRSRMEPLFGHDFSGVRVHDGSEASSLAAGLDARAFTVGQHIALGPSEYQPGSIVGDALLAHELAHVVQQAGAARAAAPLRDGSPAYDAFEQDADTAAAGAVVSLWGGTRAAVAAGLAGAVPRLRGGLGVQRCTGKTVKRCKPGKSWQAIASYGLGPTCVCSWQCRPGRGGWYTDSGEPQMSMGPAPSIDWIDDDVVRTYANAHFTPAGGETMCGCIRLTVEGDETGEEVKTALPQRPVGEATDLFPLSQGRAIGQLEGRAGARQEATPEVRSEPRPAAKSEPAPVQEPAPLPTPPTAEPPPARTGNPVVDFQARFPKVDRSQTSTAALTELFRRTSSGGRTATPRPGEYLPVQTRGAAAELRVIVDLAGRTEVVRIELIPSSSAGRTPDMLIEVRQADGTTKISRLEITAATGGGRGYKDVGAGGSTETGIPEIVSAVRRKAASTPSKPSQLTSPVPGVRSGGTLSIQLPRATSAQGPVDVALAMTILAPELAGQPHVEAIEFSIPGPKGQAPLRYTRGADGTYTLQPRPQR